MTEYVERLSAYFDFYPAFNIEHRVEQNNGGMALVSTHFVLAILYLNWCLLAVPNFIFGKHSSVDWDDHHDLDIHIAL